MFFSPFAKKCTFLLITLKLIPQTFPSNRIYYFHGFSHFITFFPFFSFIKANDLEFSNLDHNKALIIHNIFALQNTEQHERKTLSDTVKTGIQLAFSFYFYIDLFQRVSSIFILFLLRYFYNISTVTFCCESTSKNLSYLVKNQESIFSSAVTQT